MCVWVRERERENSAMFCFCKSSFLKVFFLDFYQVSEKMKTGPRKSLNKSMKFDCIPPPPHTHTCVNPVRRVVTVVTVAECCGGE